MRRGYSSSPVGLPSERVVQIRRPECARARLRSAPRRILSFMKQHPEHFSIAGYCRLTACRLFVLGACLCLMNSAAPAQSTATNLVSGVIAVPGQRDNYAFSIGAGSRFYFDSLTNSSTLLWSLTGPEGPVITDQAFSSSDAQSVSDPTVSLPAGSYTLTVRSAGGTTGGYGFRFINLADATLLSSGTVEIGRAHV